MHSQTPVGNSMTSRPPSPHRTGTPLADCTPLALHTELLDKAPHFRGDLLLLIVHRDHVVTLFQNHLATLHGSQVPRNKTPITPHGTGMILARVDHQGRLCHSLEPATHHLRKIEQVDGC